MNGVGERVEISEREYFKQPQDDDSIREKYA